MCNAAFDVLLIELFIKTDFIGWSQLSFYAAHGKALHEILLQEGV